MCSFVLHQCDQVTVNCLLLSNFIDLSNAVMILITHINFRKVFGGVRKMYRQFSAIWCVYSCKCGIQFIQTVIAQWSKVQALLVMTSSLLRSFEALDYTACNTCNCLMAMLFINQLFIINPVNSKLTSLFARIKKKMNKWN